MRQGRHSANGIVAMARDEPPERPGFRGIYSAGAGRCFEA
jgi:hypothetical protein